MEMPSTRFLTVDLPELNLFSITRWNKRKLGATSDSSSPVPKNDTTNLLPFELSEDGHAAVKRRIPKPPKLLFKMVDLKTIISRFIHKTLHDEIE
ncbi:hypothetical protein PsorP6_015000 [Peronosclerospora sorghi]|uniref:Uncharacterized protein n=1 Tax=Peronosclerospora sorghi TaxID=230839 RepID=A0ACC0VT04_9STRA|nr:hypothetical protein PsorP6_015000 [Peronosclerospora sorghi]